MSDVRMEWKTFQGKKIRFFRRGSGSALLFLHGEEGGGRWLPIHERLSQHYDCIVPEHPGFGLSDPLPSLKGIEDLVFFYLDLLDELQLEKVTVMGASLGGWLGLELATVDNRRITSLILLNSAGIYVKGVPRANPFMWSPEETVENLFVNQELGREILLNFPPGEEDVPIINRATTARLAWNPRFYNPQLPYRLHRVQAPVLILWGEEDPMFPPAYAQALKGYLPQGEIETLPRCGHYPHIEEPDRVAQLTHEFIQKCLAKGAVQ